MSVWCAFVRWSDRGRRSAITAKLQCRRNSFAEAEPRSVSAATDETRRTWRLQLTRNFWNRVEVGRDLQSRILVFLLTFVWDPQALFIFGAPANKSSAITRNRNAEVRFCSSSHYCNFLTSCIEGFRFEELRDGIQCCIVVVSFHCSVGHFHAEEGHCQDALQQCRAQHPR